MDRFVAYENIRRFKQLLEKERDPEERRTIERLLLEEQAKLDAKLESGDGAPAGTGDAARRPQPDLRTGEDPA